VAASPHGDSCFDSFYTVGLASGGVDFGVDDAGADGVDADIFFGYFFGEA
jgi:hypothetical protein